MEDEQYHSAQVKMAIQDEPTWPKASQAQFLNPNPIFGYNLISWGPLSQNGEESLNIGEGASTWDQKVKETSYDNGNSRLSISGKNTP
ncbi:hypothetical protein Patl1_15683 [Pistacia atlantica]|uniref:Uncharacterized protein n=1 Tax=Pistacia atlantica TaxID=434234 RepID=A0ACC1B925_9ROSI|nr:hypothetical protein Patl1_15683 [Pistacia atlantica]